jgi:hypothetical protein
MNTRDAMHTLLKQFGSREAFLGSMLVRLSMAGQPCDITFYSRPPVIDVVVDQRIHIALMYGVGPKKLHGLLQNISLSNGETCRLDDIWTINPMPRGGIPANELQAVDMSRAEERVGPNDETLRKMISNTYHCKSREEEDVYIRRFLAS